MGLFMKTVVSNKKGVTLLEGLIAMGLLALVATGTFGVLLSVSHQTLKPDIREEMALAIEKVNDQLHAYSQNMDENLTENTTKLCAQDLQTSPLDNGEHDIACLLPVICDSAASSFSYTVAAPANLEFGGDTEHPHVLAENYIDNTTSSKWRQITFSITCNGFTL